MPKELITENISDQRHLQFLFVFIHMPKGLGVIYVRSTGLNKPPTSGGWDRKEGTQLAAETVDFLLPRHKHKDASLRELSVNLTHLSSTHNAQV